MSTAWFVAARALHFGACLLFLGVFSFNALVAGPALRTGGGELARQWRGHLQRFGAVLLPLIFVSGLAWFVGVAGAMTGAAWNQAVQWNILKTIWTRTEFGTVWEFRLLIWLGAVGAFVSHPRAKSPAADNLLAGTTLAFGCLLTASLAWAGHGLEDSRWHLAADTIHLLAAAVWPGGLLPFLLLLRAAGRSAESPDQLPIMTLVRRFSAVSLVSVALITVTGIINSYALVGSLSNLVEQPYGRMLLVKIALFIAAVGIGAINLLNLKPALGIRARSTSDFKRTTAQLAFNVKAELIVGAIIIVVVAILGMLPPASG